LEVVNLENFSFQKDEKVLYTYIIVPKIDQTEVFKEGYKVLKAEHVFAIFPEGGSHDRTD